MAVKLCINYVSSRVLSLFLSLPELRTFHFTTETTNDMTAQEKRRRSCFKSFLFFTCWWGVVIVEHVISNIYDSPVEQARLLQGIRQDDTTGREAGDKFPIWICEFTIQHGIIVHRHRKDNETVLSRLTESINVYGQIIHVKLGQSCWICVQRNQQDLQMRWDLSRDWSPDNCRQEFKRRVNWKSHAEMRWKCTSKFNKFKITAR